MTNQCIKCRENIKYWAVRTHPNHLCGLCRDYEAGFGERNPFPNNCGCEAICSECYQSKCHRCGNVKNEKYPNRNAGDCKICKRINMRERIDGTDTDHDGNWVDSNGKVIGSYEEMCWLWNENSLPWLCYC